MKRYETMDKEDIIKTMEYAYEEDTVGDAVEFLYSEGKPRIEKIHSKADLNDYLEAFKNVCGMYNCVTQCRECKYNDENNMADCFVKWLCEDEF